MKKCHICIIVCLSPGKILMVSTDGAQSRVFVGEVSGTVSEIIRGTGGFG
jgi:inosine/xanthosine triphosphate pyrophosphatase family protein